MSKLTKIEVAVQWEKGRRYEFDIEVQPDDKPNDVFNKLVQQIALAIKHFGWK